MYACLYVRRYVRAYMLACRHVHCRRVHVHHTVDITSARRCVHHWDPVCDNEHLSTYTVGPTGACGANESV